jgi:intracellular septation protein
MQTLIELAPLIAFFVAYKVLGGIYPATAVLMVAMLFLVAWDWVRTRKVPQMHLVSAILVWVFGIATLLLRDPRFIQWKASVLYWLIAVVFCGSVFIGRKTLLERMLGTVLPEGTIVSQGTWRTLSLLNAVFYLALGSFNLWAAYRLPESTWVALKTWFFLPAIFIFTALTTFWLMRGYQEEKEPT